MLKKDNRISLRSAVLMALVSVMAFTAGCSVSSDQVLLSNDHELSSDVKAVNELTTGRQQWFAEEICIPEDSSYYQDDEVSAGAALVFNLDEPEAVYAKKVYQKMSPASLTTLFTAYTVLQRMDLSETVTVTADEVRGLTHASTVGLKAGDQVTIEQLLYGMILSSGVDAANVLADATAGNADAFVRLMNADAVRCGCLDTQFKNANGLTKSGHYTSAYDIYLIMRKLMQDKRFVQILTTDRYQAVYSDKDGSRVTQDYVSTVQYLEEGKTEIGRLKILGGKTGTTMSAGHCLVLVSSGEDGTRYLSIVMKAKSKDSLYEQTDHILNKIK
ncbi:MAG: serine hydrolase [Lachnospiraceae bacterium]|nr:serine hydrolase [Lachnospiraceae bacterium]